MIDEVSFRKMIGIWSITKMPGLKMSVVGDKAVFVFKAGPLYDMPFDLFDKLEPLEIVELLEKKVEDVYGYEGNIWRSDFSGYMGKPFSSQR